MKKMLSMAILMAATVTMYAEEPAAEESRWTTNGSASLQFTQGFVSKNWYKGGESNFSLLSTADYTFNYKSENEKFTWDNRLEGKLGFVTTPSDTCHDYMTNNDYLKYTTKFGYKAAGNWYYTLQAIGQTQFCPGYKTNVSEELSKFMNPAYLTVAIGMDYKKSLENITWTIFMGPLAYNLKFVNNPYKKVSDGADGFEGVWEKGRIDGTAFGLRNSYDYNLYDFGVNAKAMMDWKVCKYLTWSSQATYFSPLYDCGKYKGNVYTVFDWENTFDMPLNQYFSTKLYTHLRFDDSVSPEHKFGGWGYFQFTELLSFGLSYKW